MKKFVAFFAVLVMLFSMTAVPALAAQTESKNVNLYPYDGALCPEGTIDWSCSGILYIQFNGGWFEKTFGNPLYYKAVAVKLYKLEEKQGALTLNGISTKIEEQFIGTLYSKNIKSKDKYEYHFSENGTYHLSEGDYRIKIIATYGQDGYSWVEGEETIAENDFTVYRVVPQYKHCTVNILYKYDDGRVFKTDTKKLSTGTHTIENEFYDSSVTLISSSSRQVTVDSNGNGSPSTVEFVFKKNKKTDPPQNPPAEQPVQKPVSSSDHYDIGIPNLNGRVYYENDMNIAVLWVQYQMKATGKYYQGSSWDETGNLGDRTMREIGKFMQDNGYRNHDGHVDQTVINTFASYLGNRIVPVYVGGFYDKMNSIMKGGSSGSMESIDENSSRTSIVWVQMCLSKLGYYNGSIDGNFGSQTIKALKNFQQDAGYERRDYVSLGVARKLIEYCNNRGCNLSDLP